MTDRFVVANEVFLRKVGFTVADRRFWTLGSPRLILAQRVVFDMLLGDPPFFEWSNFGGTVGPSLDGIGPKQSREYLLESIVAPNKAIAKGFETAAITLIDQRVFNGTILREDDVIIEPNSPEDGPLIIRKREIKSTAKSLSAMPEGLDKLLTPFELRDLVEFLSRSQ